MRICYKYELIYSGWTNKYARFTTHHIVQSSRGNLDIADCLRRAFCAVGTSMLRWIHDFYDSTVTVRIFPSKEKDTTVWECTIHIPYEKWNNNSND